MNITCYPSDEQIAKLWLKGRDPAAEAFIDKMEFEVGTHLPLKDQIDANTVARVVLDVVADPANPTG